MCVCVRLRARAIGNTRPMCPVTQLNHIFTDVPFPSRWPSGKASASRAEGPWFESRLRRDFFGVESY